MQKVVDKMEHPRSAREDGTPLERTGSARRRSFSDEDNNLKLVGSDTGKESEARGVVTSQIRARSYRGAFLEVKASSRMERSG